MSGVIYLQMLERRGSHLPGSDMPAWLVLIAVAAWLAIWAGPKIAAHLIRRGKT